MSCAKLIKPKKTNGIDWSVLEQIKRIQHKRRLKTAKQAKPAKFRKRTPMRSMCGTTGEQGCSASFNSAI